MASRSWKPSSQAIRVIRLRRGVNFAECRFYKISRVGLMHARPCKRRGVSLILRVSLYHLVNMVAVVSSHMSADHGTHKRAQP